MNSAAPPPGPAAVAPPSPTASTALGQLLALTNGALDALGKVNAELLGGRLHAHSADGLVTAAVNGLGELVDIELNVRPAEVPPHLLARAVIEASQGAAAAMAHRRAQLFTELNSTVTEAMALDPVAAWQAGHQTV